MLLWQLDQTIKNHRYPWTVFVLFCSCFSPVFFSPRKWLSRWCLMLGAAGQGFPLAGAWKAGGFSKGAWADKERRIGESCRMSLLLLRELQKFWETKSAARSGCRYCKLTDRKRIVTLVAVWTPPHSTVHTKASSKMFTPLLLPNTWSQSLNWTWKICLHVSF